MKKLKSRYGFLQYSVWFGLMLAIAGISAGLVAGFSNPIPIAMILIGLGIVGFWMAFLTDSDVPNQPGFWQRRSTQSSTNALASTIAVLVLLGLINFLAVRSSARIDLTESRLFTLSSETQQVLKEMTQGVKAYVFSNEQNPQDRDLLENYKRQTPNFTFEYVDPEANPVLAKAFDIKNTGPNRDIFLELQLSKRRQFLQSVNEQVRLTESRLTNGILQITNDRRLKAYFLQGHGEKPLTQGEGSISIAAKALDDKNFTGEPLNLARVGKVPADANVILVVGPTRPLLEAEIKALDDYLNQGGNVLVAVDPSVKTGLDGLLNSWGAKFDDRIAINAPEQQISSAGPSVLVVNQYGDHPITKDFGNGISFYPFARPIDVTQIAGVQATPLLLTDSSSWAESNIKQPPYKLDGGDRPGPLTIGVAFSRTVTPKAPSPSPSPTASPSPKASPSPSPSPTGSPKVSKESRLVVLGNSTFVVDGIFGQQLNGDVFLNSVGWLSQEARQPLSIRPKEIKNRRITLSNEQATILGVLAIALVPLFGFIAAGVVWWRRR
jgi:ABC-type uncharacterized transport system involved in gliding motility auxiliary subunit